MNDADALIPEEELERLSTMGRAIYREKLQAILEPTYNGQDVAIHLETGDYEVGMPNAFPSLALRKRHPEGGMIMVTDIGPPRSHEMLAARILASRYLSEHKKRSTAFSGMVIPVRP